MCYSQLKHNIGSKRDNAATKIIRYVSYPQLATLYVRSIAYFMHFGLTFRSRLLATFATPSEGGVKYGKRSPKSYYNLKETFGSRLPVLIPAVV